MSRTTWGNNGPDTPRAKFNTAVEAAGLEVLKTSCDGWVYSAQRKDGLRVWRVASSQHGVGIATAWIVRGLFTEHRYVWNDNYAEALRLALLRKD